MTQAVIHITRPAQIGGTITSTLRQAAAEIRRGRDVEVWSMLQTQREAVCALAPIGAFAPSPSRHINPHQTLIGFGT